MESNHCPPFCALPNIAYKVCRLKEQSPNLVRDGRKIVCAPSLDRPRDCIRSQRDVLHSNGDKASAIACHDDTDLFEEDLVKSLVAGYGSDAIATLRALIAACKLGQNALLTASNILSCGLAQGWQPGVER